MIVRDRTKPKTEYKGRPTEACDELCPCRPCYNAHDCGYNAYSGHVVEMKCATRENRGCPQLQPEPAHIFKSNRARKCLRCGEWRIL